MWKSFFTDKKWMFWCYGGGLLILSLIVFQTWLSVQFNTWYGTFYDLLQKPPETGGLEKFYERLTYFLYLAIPYVTTYSFTNWFTRMWTFRWREAITFSYMPYWRKVDTKVEGASQRIQEDCRDFATIVEKLGLKKHKFFLISVHREENVDNDVNFKCLTDLLNDLGNQGWHGGFRYPQITQHWRSL